MEVLITDKQTAWIQHNLRNVDFNAHNIHKLTKEQAAIIIDMAWSLKMEDRMRASDLLKTYCPV